MFMIVLYNEVGLEFQRYVVVGEPVVNEMRVITGGRLKETNLPMSVVVGDRHTAAILQVQGAVAPVSGGGNLRSVQ